MTPRKPYETGDEIAFMRGLIRDGKITLADRYCRMVLRNERRWEAGIDVDRVMAGAEECLAIIRALESGVAA